MQYNEHSYIPILAHKSYVYDNHLIIPKIAKNWEECDILCVGENTNRFILFSLGKCFEKVKSGGLKFIVKIYW